MTLFYCFDSASHFADLDGRVEGEYIHEGIGVSVIGEQEDGSFLVNAASAVEAWSQWKVSPETPVRLFA